MLAQQTYFHDEAAAHAKLERLFWPDGPLCPHCGSGGAYSLTGKSTRVGLKKCPKCRKQFTVKVGTFFESTHLPLHKWFQLIFLVTTNKKPITTTKLAQILEVTYKTTWQARHRLEENLSFTMRQSIKKSPRPLKEEAAEALQKLHRQAYLEGYRAGYEEGIALLVKILNEIEEQTPQPTQLLSHNEASTSRPKRSVAQTVKRRRNRSS